MKTNELPENFSCIEMKRQIQAKIYEETKNMTIEELLAYYNIPPEKDPYRGRKTTQPLSASTRRVPPLQRKKQLA